MATSQNMTAEHRLELMRSDHAQALQRVRGDAAREHDAPAVRPGTSNYWTKHLDPRTGAVLPEQPDAPEGPELPVIDGTESPAVLRQKLGVAAEAGSFGEQKNDPRAHATAVRQQHQQAEPEPFDRSFIKGHASSEFAGDVREDPRSRSATFGRTQ